MAVNDEMVQSLVALGILDMASAALGRSLDCDGKTDPKLVATALGVFRNVSGNDGIKSTLCTNGTLGCLFESILIDIAQNIFLPLSLSLSLAL
jgi:hypothetical protein